MVPLFIPGAPGGPELLIALVLTLVVPLAFIAALYSLLASRRTHGERIRELEARVEALEEGRNP
ncbi:hypothetical protein ACFQMM_07170 [Saliphagus sp. GCM10025308]